MKTNLKKTIAFVSSLAMLASTCAFNTFAASAYETTNENLFIHTKDFEKYRDEITQEEDDKSQDDNIESTTLALKKFTDSVGRTYNVYDYDEKYKNSTHHLHSLQTGLLYLEITLEPNITVTQEMLDEIEAAMPHEEMGYDFYEEIYYQPKKGSLYENYRFSGTGRFIKGEEPVRQYYDGDDLEPENELAHTLIITPHVLKYSSDYLSKPENNLQGIKTPDLSYVTIPDVEGPMVCSTSSDYDGVSHTVSNSNLIALGREDLIYSGRLYDVVKYEDTVKKLCDLDFVCDENQGRLYNLNGVEEFKPYYGQGWYNAVQYAEMDGINLSTTSINGSGSPYKKYLEEHKSDKTKPLDREKLNYKLDYDSQTLYVDYNKTTGGKPINSIY